MKKTLLFLLFFLTTFKISAQDPTDADQSFGSYPGFNDEVFVTVLQPDGKTLVGGLFRAYRGAAERGLIRLNSDGSKDTSFSTGIDGTIYSIALQDDGKIIVGGTFIKFNNTTQNYLIRLNPDGTKDSTFDIGSGFTSKKNDNNFLGVVSSILIQNDGKIIVGGNFIEYQGMAQKSLIRLNSDGSKDSSFDIGNGFDNGVYCIARQNDGKIIVGGMFNYFQGRSSRNIVRLNDDGSEDKTFKKGNGFDYYVKSLIIQPDEKILASGFFYEYDGDIERHLVRLNKDGTNDTSFYIRNGFNGRVDAIALRQDGKIMVGGVFTNYSLTNNYHLIRLNTDGSMDTSFNIGNGFSIYNGLTVRSISIQPDGKLILGGDFTSFQDLNENYLIRLNEHGSKDSSFDIGSGLNNLVNIVTIQSDQKILVGGKFNKYQGIHQKNLIRFNYNGSKDESFNIGEGFNGAVNSISQQIDGKIIVGGAFSKFKNENNFNLIRLNSDGAKDNSFNIGDKGFSGDVNTTVIQPDGKILVGGNFGSYQSLRQGGLIRLNINGSKDSSFDIGTGFNADVFAIALQTDGKIIVGGKFKQYQGVSQNYLIRLNNDGSKDTTFDIGEGFGSIYTLGDIQSIILQSDGKILVGGQFSFFQGNKADRIIRLNSDGSRDKTFKSDNIFSGAIFSMALQEDGKILVVGGISPRVARVNSDGSFDKSFTGAKFSIPNFSISENDLILRTVALQSNGKIVIGGAFTSYKNDNASAFLLRLNGNYVATPIVPTITKTNVTCAGSEGSASITVYGGKTPYTYLWSNGATTAEITGLAVGDYSCNVTDADLTTITENFAIITIADTQNPTITAPLNISVNTNSGCTAINVALGTPITTDNCAVVSVTNDAPAAFSIGNTTVTWTVKDASDNIATATQIVTVKGLDAKVTNNSGILTATETEALYKWFECNNGLFTEILNENKVSFTPVKIGSYAVEINKNGCSITSTCYELKTLGTKDFDLKNSLKLYPNPSKDFVTIEINSEYNTKLKVFNINSQCVLSKELKNGSNTVNISHLSIGVYLFEILNETGKTIKKVIKK